MGLIKENGKWQKPRTARGVRYRPVLTQAEASGDSLLAFGVFALVVVGILMVYSTTALLSFEIYGSPWRMIIRHLVHVILGSAAFIWFASFKPDWLRNLGGFALIIALGLLVLVLVPGLGDSAGGAQRWLILGPFRMQPGEITKLLVVLYLASYIERHHRTMANFLPGVLRPLGVASVLAFLLLLEPDFGSAVVIFLVVSCQLLTVSRLSHLASVGAVGVGFAIALIVSSPYRLARFNAFLDPFADPSASGYQLIQSLLAVSKGSILGVGLGAGEQKLFYLPAAHTDFIYAVIAEEFGLLGALAVLGLFCLVAWRGIKIATRVSGDAYLFSLAVGCTALLVLPALLNIGVVTGLLPTKGMVLPFVAYGGTAMLVYPAVAGILYSTSRVQNE